jgi:hypothetical protein
MYQCTSPTKHERSYKSPRHIDLAKLSNPTARHSPTSCEPQINMQFSLSTLMITLALLGGSQAVVVCSGYNSPARACVPPCTSMAIALNEVLETPGTNCIYNSDSDGGFNLRICSGSELSGRCSNLSDQPREDITGDFNWHTPGTNSILRTGN